VLLITAPETPAAGSESGTAAGPSGFGRGAPARAADLPTLARALGVGRILCGFGVGGEALRAAVRTPAAEVVPGATGAAQALWGHAQALSGFDGDLLVLPAGGEVQPAALLAALGELHVAEGNAATLLTADVGAAGGLAVRRDACGRVTGLGPADPPGEDDEAAGEVCNGTMMLHWPRLLAVLRARAASPGAPPADLAHAVTWLHAAGARVGSQRARDLLGACPRCHEQPRASEQSGVLLVTAHACLAIERPGFNSGQLACYPRRHVTCALSLGREEWSDLAILLREGERLLRRVYRFDALNVGLSSGVGSHLTVQLIPRWLGDVNFLPLVSGFKPVPESPQMAWRRLREVMA